MTRLKKKQRWLLSAGFFRLADFPQKQQECFSEDHDRFISVDSVGREKSIYTTSNFFQVVVLILEAAITFWPITCLFKCLGGVLNLSQWVGKYCLGEWGG